MARRLVGRFSRDGLPRSPHADKFRIALAGLIGIALGAVAVAVAVLFSGSTTSAQTSTWSSWSPSSGGAAGATEIADHVAPFYRINAADQLDVVSVMSLGNPNAASTGNSGMLVAVNSSSSSAQDLSLLGGDTIAYNLCGLGHSNCTISGAASSNRLLLLRREALELALYTFKYLPKVQNVIAVLPPGHAGSLTTGTTTTATTSTLSTKPPSTKAPASTSSKPLTVAVLFVRQELNTFLEQPLDTSLSEYPPDMQQLSLWKSTEEAGLVDQITAEGLFSEQIEDQQDGSNLLVLNPLPPQ
jgi:hypothetical protein